MSDGKYGLYVVRPKDIGEEERHFLITAEYCLLYTKNAPPQKSVEISDLSMLPETAKQWLNGAIDDVRREYLANNQNEILKRAKTFNERFAEELLAMREGQGRD